MTRRPLLFRLHIKRKWIFRPTLVFAYCLWAFIIIPIFLVALIILNVANTILDLAIWFYTRQIDWFLECKEAWKVVK